MEHLYSIILNSSKVDGPCVRQLTQPFELGEAPTWDDRIKLLYFVDILAGNIYSYDPVTTILNSIQLDGDVTPVVPTVHDTHVFVAGLNRSLVAIRWDPKGSKLQAVATLTTVAKQFPTSRFNDGKADAQGKLWIGTMGPENTNLASLYLITKENIENPKVVIAPANISNGVAWNKANTKFFYIDSPTRQVRVYDFDLNSGEISNPKVVFDVREHDELTGNPDGMTIDEDDNIWVALNEGGAVVKVDTNSLDVLHVIAIPASDVTSVAWGGDNLDVLFVTSARIRLNAEERRQQPAAGSLFAVYNLGTRGLPTHYVDVINDTNFPA
ncbi:regucalcin-like isoform X4 [Agrilus planipennis]|uniref:Regucalcin-like isoform X4 n=1 Tax=Agrilus planipennis TaxID=224129 RepID=A0A7F5R0C3_AGRPL|nr:regucalcin-like isoform X4 [Agrilus planipennis]